MIKEKLTLCETIKRLGYAHNTQVKLYGEIFELVSDPVEVGDNFVFVDGIEMKSGSLRRVRIPLPIVRIAKKALQAA
jgi:hypothetical protein